MRYVRLGKTELRVSAIGFGTWAFGGDWGAFDEAASRAAIHHALDRGVTLFDTAEAYGFGRSESLLADALRGRGGRDDVVLATKGGLRMEGTTLVRDASARALRRGVEASLRNLRTDHIDLYQVHWPDARTPAEETARLLEDLVAEGKVRHIGVSNYEVAEMVELASYGRLETLQPPYHLFRRDIEEHVLPYAEEHDIGVLVYGPLAHGLLSGRIDRRHAIPGGRLAEPQRGLLGQDVPAEPPRHRAPAAIRGGTRHDAAAARGCVDAHASGRTRGHRRRAKRGPAGRHARGGGGLALPGRPRGSLPDPGRGGACERPVTGGDVIR
jgi:aryl-alcohol dehydrogenase-like predicted oxidoreductase